MILKLLIMFYRWLFGLPPLVIDLNNFGHCEIVVFACIIDLIIIGLAIGLFLTCRKNKE